MYFMHVLQLLFMVIENDLLLLDKTGL